MFYKLNSEAEMASPEKCNIGDETSNNNLAIDIEGSDGKRQHVANYHKVMTQDFNVPKERFFNAIPLNVNHLKSFIESNGPAIKACRIYITKSTTDPTVDDYE